MQLIYRIGLLFSTLLLLTVNIYAVNNGRAISLDGSTQYLSATTPSSGTYPATASLDQGANVEARFRNLRLSHGSDQTLFEMTGFGRLLIVSGGTTLRFSGRDGSNADVTLGALTNIIVRFGTKVGSYTASPFNYVQVWNENYDSSSELYASASAVSNSSFDLSSRTFTIGARVAATEKAQVQVGFLRLTRNGLTRYINYPSYWDAQGQYNSPLAAWYFEDTLASNTNLGAMTLTLTNNGSAGYIDTPNVLPHANAGPDQSTASVGRFLLDGSGSYDVDNTTGQYYRPDSHAWSQLTGTTLTMLDSGKESTFVDGCINGNTYTFRLTVTDSKAETATDDISITCTNVSSAITASNTTPYVGQVVRFSSTAAGYANFLRDDGYFGAQIDDGQGYGVASISLAPESATAYLTAGSKTATQTVKNHSGTIAQNTANVTVSALPTSFGTTIPVASGGNIQTAINTAAAATGTVLIELEQGASFTITSSLILKKKTDSALIWIRSAGYSNGSFPTLEKRIDPVANASLLATITTSTAETPLITTEVNQPVENYILTGLKITSTVQDTGGLIALGYGDYQQTSLTQLPRNIAIHHCWITGPISTSVRIRHGIFVNARDVAMIGNYIDEIHDDSESHGVIVLNTDGGVVFWNNYDAATGINFFVGGATGEIPEITPSHFSIRRNYFFKHLKWQRTDFGGTNPPWDGSQWNIKNNLEFKTGRFIAVDSNIYENSWVQGDQVGYGTNFNNTIDNAWGKFEWGQLTNSKYINTGTGHTLRGRDEKIWKGEMSVMRHLLVRNNLYNPVGDILLWIPAGGYVANVLRGMVDFGFVHNTSDETGPSAFNFSGAEPLYRPKVLNNIGPHNTYGWKGDGSNPGTPSFNVYTVGIDFRGNLLAGADSGQYPAGGSGNDANHYPAANQLTAQYVNYAAGNFVLAVTSEGKNAATDGTDIGADIGLLNLATFGVTSGLWQLTPTAQMKGVAVVKGATVIK